MHDFEEKEGSDEWEECKEVKTLNAMTPIWKRNKGDVKDADYKEFYRATYYDMEEPLHYFRISSEGGLTYDAVVFVLANPPYDYYTSDYKRGLSLYVNGVMIMDKCEELVPEYFGFYEALWTAATYLLIFLGRCCKRIGSLRHSPADFARKS